MTVDLAPPLDFGPSPDGHHRTVPITGGTLDGPALSGHVLPGGADWQRVLPDGTIFVEARALSRILAESDKAEQCSSPSMPVAAPAPRESMTPRRRGLRARSRWLDLGWAVAITVAFDTQRILDRPVDSNQALIAGSAAVACLAMTLRRAVSLAAFTVAAATAMRQ